MIEEGITSIGLAAFCGTAAEEVSLPEGLTTIGDSAFLDSDNLERVILPASVTTLSRYAFAECRNLGLLFAQSDSLSIGEYCFSDNYMCLLYPEGGTVTYGTFDAYGLSRCAYDPEEYAADGTVGSGICGDNAQWTVGIDGVALVRGTGEVTSSDSLSAYKYFLTEITFSAKLEMSSIASSWMKNAKHLRKISFPSGLKTINEYAFYYCVSLEEIVIPDSVTKIGESAFESCHSLRVAYIPGTPTTVDKAAFSGCDHLTEVHFTGTTTTLKSNSYNDEGNVFNGCTALETIYLPQKSVTFGKAFADCALLKNFIVPEDSDYFLDERGVLYHNDGNEPTLVRAPVTLAGEYTPIEGC